MFWKSAGQEFNSKFALLSAHEAGPAPASHIHGEFRPEQLTGHRCTYFGPTCRPQLSSESIICCFSERALHEIAILDLVHFNNEVAGNSGCAGVGGQEADV